MENKYSVSIEKLKKKCNSKIFEGETTEDLLASRELIGQERAMEALKYGLSVDRKGYNIYVSGLTGTGRNSYSYLVAKELAASMEPPKDWCYVYNFKSPGAPKAISLKNGQGKIFKKDVENMVDDLKEEIPRALDSKEFEDNKNLTYTVYQDNAQQVLSELNELAESYNFVFRQNERGILSIPLKDGKPMTDEEINSLNPEETEELMILSNELNKKALDYVKRIKEIENELIIKIEELTEEKILEVAIEYIKPLEEKHAENKGITEFLKDMKLDIVKNYEAFIEKKEERQQIQGLILGPNTKVDKMKRYEINLFLDNSEKSEAQVIRDTNPTYYNLLGKIEYINQLGGYRTDHTRIKPGTLHKANGGYLIIQVKDLLTSVKAWEGLKRALITDEIKIENITNANILSETLSPEPIPLDVKIILIGDFNIYQLLYIRDDDFKKLFKIRADFDVEMNRTDKNIKKIGSFVASQCKEEKLRPFDRTALSKIIEYSGRLADQQEKLTAKFNELVEIIYEADQWAKINNKDIVTDAEVDLAIEKRDFRNDMYEEKLLESIEDNVLMIDTEGDKIGEINGLAVITIGQYAFGKPNKITVNTFAGKDGIINIEREVEQSGNIYDKGVLILGGYLGEKYAQDFPLSLTASITFEQSYSGIDGDSASSTELYALLSSLSGKPINQSIAVTGSVNQKGLIQPIGGVNEKVEGFYKIAKMRGLTGREGVIIPYQNVKNLMLDDEVIESVKEGKFNIYAVKLIDEGIEILTGVKSGELNEKGQYDDGTINYLVQEKLKYYSELDQDK